MNQKSKGLPLRPSESGMLPAVPPTCPTAITLCPQLGPRGPDTLFAGVGRQSSPLLCPAPEQLGPTACVRAQNAPGRRRSCHLGRGTDFRPDVRLS